METSLEEIRKKRLKDAALKRDLPGGPCWRRYSHDGYGQKPDGAAYDGTGEGRSWPILTGERGHYELAAGRDPKPFIEAMERFANGGHLLAEQLWDTGDTADGEMIFGHPTGSATPLCWSHAEYLSLVRSHRDGKVFDRIEPAYERYVERQVSSAPPECWTFRHRIHEIPAGAPLGRPKFTSRREMKRGAPLQTGRRIVFCCILRSFTRCRSFLRPQLRTPLIDQYTPYR